MPVAFHHGFVAGEESGGMSSAKTKSETETEDVGRSSWPRDPETDGEGIPLVLDGLPQTSVCYVIVVALIAKRLTATFHEAVRANREAAIATTSHGAFAADSTYIAVAGHVFDLASLNHD
jgi:hypothetical protein